MEESQFRKKTGTFLAEPTRKNHPRKQGSEKYPSVLQLPLLGATTGTRNHFHWYSHLTWKGFFNTVTMKNMVQQIRKSLATHHMQIMATHGMQISFPSATMAWDVYLMVVSKALAS
jgi:hypothetical protein